jgi:hypothetical protein
VRRFRGVRWGLPVVLAVSLSACGDSGQDGGGHSGESGGKPTPCQTNAECVASPEAEAIKNYLCGPREAYCLDGGCHAECRESCTVARSDTNPCPYPGQCERVQFAPADPILGFCTARPIACTTVDNCPDYLPPLPSGGTGEWTCEGGLCTYPEFEYATH